MKTFKQFQEAIALAPLAIPVSKLVGAGLAATGLTGMVLQSKKKKDGLPLDKLGGMPDPVEQELKKNPKAKERLSGPFNVDPRTTKAYGRRQVRGPNGHEGTNNSNVEKVRQELEKRGDTTQLNKFRDKFLKNLKKPKGK
tara:strand:+ start:40 stop:459 length:420 start_codon:yes stop_codon:yes gene_type:complete